MLVRGNSSARPLPYAILSQIGRALEIQLSENKKRKGRSRVKSTYSGNGPLTHT